MRRKSGHLIASIVQAIVSHPDKSRLIALEESSNNHHTPFSEQSKEMIHSSGNVEGFELCQLSERIQCPHRLGFSTRRILHCDCGTCLIPSEQVRQLNNEQFDVLTIPFFTIEKGTYRGYRCDRSDERKSYQQAKVASWKAKTKGFSSIHDRFLQQESYRNSEMEIAWTEETGLLINTLASEDHFFCRDAC